MSRFMSSRSFSWLDRAISAAWSAAMRLARVVGRNADVGCSQGYLPTAQH